MKGFSAKLTKDCKTEGNILCITCKKGANLMLLTAIDRQTCSHVMESMHRPRHVQVLIVWFGEFPEVPKGVPAQIFSIAMAVTGLAAFAIVLAIVEQLVLEILTQNVSRGSQVYETGHILVLAWAWTQRDREVIWKILSQASPRSEIQQAACTAAPLTASAPA